MKRSMMNLLVMMPLALAAQTFNYDMTKVQPTYSEQTGYGYDVLPAPAKNSSEPWYFSIKVPDGNYKVRVTLGSNKRAANTTVRAENRRLMEENINTKKKELKTFEFIVNKRSPQIDATHRVSLKEREKTSMSWDDKLTLEFNGKSPAVTRIQIERDTTATTIYLCGNSTVVDQSDEPWASWGQMIPRWFDANIAISNHGESGLTARTFLGAHRLDKILSTLRKGDYVVCEFGHNDEKEHKPGDGAWYHYTYNLKIFIDQVRAKGAHIIFCTSTARRAFEQDHKTLRNTHGDFPAAMKAVAEREQVPLIDLNQMSTTLFETLGEENSKRALVHYPINTFAGQTQALADNTHFNPYGAYEISKCIVMGMKQLGLPIVQDLRSDWQDFSPAAPDDWKTFQWAPAKNADLVKPDGN